MNDSDVSLQGCSDLISIRKSSKYLSSLIAFFLLLRYSSLTDECSSSNSIIFPLVLFQIQPTVILLPARIEEEIVKSFMETGAPLFLDYGKALKLH